MGQERAWKDLPLDDIGARPGLTVERRWLPDADGQFTRCVAYSTVPHLTAGLGSDGFSWGDSSPGSYDLALNVLEEALRRRSHQGPRSDAPDCFTLALLLRSGFVTDVVAQLPPDGGRVSFEAIDRWIDARCGALPSATAALLAPRYIADPRTSDEHWSRGEWEQLTGEHLTVRGHELVTSTGGIIARQLTPHPMSAAGWESHPL